MTEPDAIIMSIGMMLGFWLMLLLLFYIFWPRR
jgi:hypothetical protein